MCVKNQPDDGLDPIVNLKSTSSRCLTFRDSLVPFSSIVHVDGGSCGPLSHSQSLLASFGMSCMHHLGRASE